MIKRSGRKNRVMCFVAALAVMISMSFALMPAEVNAFSIEKLHDAMSVPYAITANGEQIAVVNGKEEAQAVLTGVKLAYCSCIASEQASEITTPVEVVKVSVNNVIGAKIQTVDEAIKSIVKMNATSKVPVIKVTCSGYMTGLENISFKTKIVNKPAMNRGTHKIARAGVKGKARVSRFVTKVNGKIVKTEVLSSKVVKSPVTRIIYKGTKPVETETATAASSSGSYSGAAAPYSSGTPGVVGFAEQFIGNPYVWGGTSLTGGCDCSGFTMGVYGHFGISLPHSSYAQASCGSSVGSLSQARPGDLLCYGGHVAIYIGGGQVVHAANPSKGICIGPAGYRSIQSIRRFQ